MNERPRHLDLFSGIGGFSLAFQAEGFETIGSAKSIPTPAPCSESIGQECQTSETCETSRPLDATCSQVDFLASHSVLPGSNEARRMTVRSGLKCLPLSTDAGPLGLWRTLGAQDGMRGAQDGEERLAAGHTLSLASQVKTPKLWPTPRAEFDSGKHCGKPDTLHSAVKMWPTPQASDAKTAAGFSADFLARRLEQRAPKLSEAHGVGQLNPNWVEWLMGYPIGHTALNASETASFLKSRKSSPAPSTNL